jgi:hypothetical protein
MTSSSASSSSTSSKILINDSDIPIVPDLLLDIQKTRNFSEAVSSTTIKEIDFLHRQLINESVLHGTEHPIVLGNLSKLADLYTESHLYYIGERILKRLQTALKRTFLSPHLSIASSLTRLGDILNQQIKYKEAEKYYLESYSQYKQLLKDEITVDLRIAMTYQGK